jgi:uncharacterized Zn-binding protein involved in type VI secretion
MSGGSDGVAKLKLSDPSGSSANGNVAFGKSIEDEIAQAGQLAEYEQRIKHLERNIAKLRKNLGQTTQPNPQGKPVKQGEAQHVAHAEGWKAVCTAPDFCKVGKDVVAFNSFASLDQKRTASPNVKARGTAIYRKGDVLQNVQADAGEHVVSGTSLGSGHVKILDGHPNVKVNGVPVARHDSRCLINCDAAGGGGAPGKLVTEQKTVGTTAPLVGSDMPPGQRTSAKLEALKKARDAVESDMLDFNALDEYVNFGQLHKELDRLIQKISAEPGTGADFDAQLRRGLLGFAKDAILGIGELAYEGIKAVPKIARLTQTQIGQLHAQLNAQLLAENIRIGNITPKVAEQAALNIGKAIIAPVTDPWAKGQYVESVTRGVTEAGTLGLGWLKGNRAARVAKSADSASSAVASKGVGRTAISGSVDPTITPIRPGPSHLSAGVHVSLPKKPAFSGNWDNYRTHGLTIDPMKSVEGRRMVQEFLDQGLDQAEAIRATNKLIETGSSLPQANPFEIGDKLYKVVSEGGTVGAHSEYWMTRDQLSSFKGMSYDEIADRLGLPLASQQGVRYQVVEITAWRSGTTFTSVVAQTSEIGANGVVWSQSGKGIQTLVTDRSKFTLPKLINIDFP